MLPNELPFCCGDIRLSADNFATDIAERVVTDFSDPYNLSASVVSFDGWVDHSGFGNHLLVRQGSVTYENDANGVSCAVFDNVLLATMRQYFMTGAGTLVVAGSGGYAPNKTRDWMNVERFDATRTRTGNSAWQLGRFVGFGINRFQWGLPGHTVSLNPLAGSTPGDMTVQRAAFATDQKSVRKKIYAKREGVAFVSATPSETGLISPKGADLVIGRLRADQTDATRTAATGNERLLLSHVQMFANFDRGNLVEDYPTELEALFAGMTS